MRHVWWRLIAGLGVWWATNAAAGVGAIDQFREFSSMTRAARGEFTQSQVRPDGSPSAPAKGRFWFARPGRFRWEIKVPYEQLVVTAGEQVQFYDKDLKQLTVRRVEEAFTATPAAILLGGQDVQRFFMLKEVGLRDGIDWLEATPKQTDAGFEWVRLGLRSSLPVAMEVRDAFGHVTRFDFHALERNPVLDAAVFRFTPPAGVEVVQ